MAPRVGIAGYGLAGRYFHAPLLVGAGFEIASILTKNEQRILDAKTDFPNSQICNSLEDLLKSNIDLLVVASANQSHAEQAIAGLKAGIPVVVDKPMGPPPSGLAERAAKVFGNLQAARAAASR